MLSEVEASDVKTQNKSAKFKVDGKNIFLCRFFIIIFPKKG